MTETLENSWGAHRMPNLAEIEWGWNNGRALIGIVLIYFVAWLLSEHKSKFPWKVVLGATVLQFAIAGLLFGIPIIRDGLFYINNAVDGLQAASRAGTSFVFGYVGDNTLYAQNPTVIPGQIPPPLFFFQILPMIIVVASLSAILWHWGILKWITNAFAVLFQRTMGLSGHTALGVSANIFMGMTEAPVLIKPYIKSMTRTEIFITMTAGFATIAGSVLVVYGAFLEGKMDNPVTQLLVASILASPAAVAVAMTMVPETEAHREVLKHPDNVYSSTMDAFSTGATDGLKIMLNIATMLIAALALLYLVNLGLKQFPDVLGAPLSIERILGWVFAPLMYMIGVPMEEAAKSGSLMGVKTVLTEFVAFLQLAELPADAMEPRTRLITAYAICGFANFGSMGILIGGMTIIEPDRRDEFLSLAWLTLVAGTFATCLSGAVVGALPYALFTGPGG
jgi:concentrative nucleoside transporter, CNT family